VPRLSEAEENICTSVKKDLRKSRKDLPHFWLLPDKQRDCHSQESCNFHTCTGLTYGGTRKANWVYVANRK
jgi:hypothetical protein